MSITTKNTGFTLIELLVTLAMLAIVAMYAVPSFEEMVKDNRITSQVKEISSLVAFARSEATKGSGAYITVCPTSDNTTCSGANWTGGWMIMLDWNGDRTINAGAGSQTDRLLRAVDDLSGGNTLSATGFSASSSYVQFDSTGMPISVGTLGTTPGTFIVCDDRGANEARAIVVMASGQQRLAVDTSGDGNSIVEDHSGSSVTCN